MGQNFAKKLEKTLKKVGKKYEVGRKNMMAKMMVKLAKPGIKVRPKGSKKDEKIEAEK